MKNLICLFAFAFLLSCSDDNDSNISTQSDFCTLDRTLDSELFNKEGTLVYREGKDKFAIQYYPMLPTIDEVTYYFLCEKPVGIETGSGVIFSGKSYKFNEDEGFVPSVGGTKYYFFKLTNITQN